MQEIRDGYMAKADAFVASALKALEPIHEKMAELNSEVRFNTVIWHITDASIVN